VSGVLSSTGSVVAYPSGDFLGVTAASKSATAFTSDPGIQSYLNSTDIGFYKLEVSADYCNQTIDRKWSDSGTELGRCSFNDSSFVEWCMSKLPACHSGFVLPGEINSTIVAQETVRYVEGVLHYHPDYWQVGVRPSQWRHYNIPWPQWRNTDQTSPSKLAYALEVRAYAAAVGSVDPSAKVYAVISAHGTAVLTDIYNITHVNGGSLSGINIDLYPGGIGTPTGTLSDFYQGLTQPYGPSYWGSIPYWVPQWRAAALKYCAGCTSLQLFPNEYNGAVYSDTGTFNQYLISYPDAVFMAASIVQGLRANLTSLVYQTLQAPHDDPVLSNLSLIDANGGIRPIGYLYSQVLPHLCTSEVLGTTITSQIAAEAFDSETVCGKNHSVLLVNTNLTTALNLTWGQVVPVGSTANSWSWNPDSALPVASNLVTKSFIVVPAQGIVLVDF
jgi:hypothetical protein